MKYHIDTLGCQMNTADTQRLASELEKLGGSAAATPEEAEVIVLNTCVVRQSAEDKAYSWLHRISHHKRTHRPDLVVGLMGCLVGVKGNAQLGKTFPLVDVFLPPSDPAPLVQYLTAQYDRQLLTAAVGARHQMQDGELVLPLAERGRLVSAHVPVVYGCSFGCTFCIIPFRRGIERSRPAQEVETEVRSLAAQGVREVTLLGQIVDRYGADRTDGASLPGLLRLLQDVDGIDRIRFLTSHPNFMTDELLATVAELPKVCENIEVPVQSGSDAVLANMSRGYTRADYSRLIERIRKYMPHGSIACDVIVGFPGETAADYEQTRSLLADLQLDTVHLAKYSARAGTVSARRMPDTVSEDEKEARRAALDEQQAGILSVRNQDYVGRVSEVLVEDKQRGRWRGRTRTNKLVFFDDERDWRGQLANVAVSWAGPWHMRGEVRV